MHYSYVIAMAHARQCSIAVCEVCVVTAGGRKTATNGRDLAKLVLAAVRDAALKNDMFLDAPAIRAAIVAALGKNTWTACVAVRPASDKVATLSVWPLPRAAVTQPSRYVRLCSSISEPLVCPCRVVRSCHNQHSVRM